MKRNCVYIFLERNMGHGFETAYPDISTIRMRFYQFVIGHPKSALSKHFGFIVYHRSEIDEDCADPRSKGRSPKIEISAIFPWNFEAKHLCSKTGNSFLQECWDVAKKVNHKGTNTELEIILPAAWYINKEK